MPIGADALRNPYEVNMTFNNFQCNLALPKNYGVTDILKSSADLIYGKLTQLYFDHSFKESRIQKLSVLLSLIDDTNPNSKSAIKYLDFQFKMLHEALNNDTRLPALLIKHKKTVYWHTGGTRLLAYGMAKSNPANYFPILMSNFDRDGVEKIVDNFVPVNTDTELCDILKIEYFDRNNGLKQNCNLYLEWDRLPGPCLHYIKLTDNENLDWSNHTEIMYADKILKSLLPWKNKKIPISVWVNDISQISDSSGWFDIKHAGPGVTKVLPHRVTLMVSRNFGEIKNPNIWQIWVAENRKIDLSEILFWIDDRYNVYCDHDGEFACLTSPGPLVDKTISLSSIR